MSQYVSTSKESALVACVTQEIYPEQSARHVARGTCVCVCVRVGVCVCVTMCTQRVEQERSKRMIKIDRVCVCVFMFCMVLHTPRAPEFFKRASPQT